MNERLTKWKEYETNKRLYRSNKEVSISDLVWKLGKLEDILEKYNINTNEELEVLCKYTEDVKHWMFIYKEKMIEINKIEDELGIDLITLFKALKNGIYAYDHANNIDHMKVLNIFYDTKDMECKTDFDGDIFEYDFADYGVSWALTKEEL